MSDRNVSVECPYCGSQSHFSGDGFGHFGSGCDHLFYASCLVSESTDGQHLNMLEERFKSSEITNSLEMVEDDCRYFDDWKYDNVKPTTDHKVARQETPDDPFDNDGRVDPEDRYGRHWDADLFCVFTKDKGGLADEIAAELKGADQ